MLSEQLGVAGYLRKPFKLDRLLAPVTRLAGPGANLS
jgi:hypothetical protein